MLGLAGFTEEGAAFMKIIKRSGTEVTFDIEKIISAIKAANAEVGDSERLTDRQVVYAAQNVAEACEKCGHTVSVEEVQDMVEDEIMALDRYEVARRYIIYRYVQGLKRTKNTTDDKILSLIECNNEEVKQENSNKNPTVNSVQRRLHGQRGLQRPHPARAAAGTWSPLITRASSTSMTRITLPSTCTIAICERGYAAERHGHLGTLIEAPP